MPWLLLGLGVIGVWMMRGSSTQLTKNFNLSEWATSALAPDLVEIPRGEHAARARFGAVHILQPLRDAVAVPVTITSGYRPPALNAVIPGSSDTSDHMNGAAVDIIAPPYTNHELIQVLWELAQAGKVRGIDQVITYNHKGHLHIGWGDRQRNEWSVKPGAGMRLQPWSPV